MGTDRTTVDSTQVHGLGRQEKKLVLNLSVFLTETADTDQSEAYIVGLWYIVVQ